MFVLVKNCFDHHQISEHCAWPLTVSHAVYVFTGEILGIMFLPPVSSGIPKNSQEVSK